MLDLHFSRNEPKLFAVAASTGIICLFIIELLHTEPIRHLKTIELADPSILVLSLAWCPSKEDASVIAASLSDGRIVTLDYESPRSSMNLGVSHSLEVWTLAWSAISDVPESLQLYSGGDDSAICRHYLKSNQLHLVESSADTELAEYCPLSRDSKIHMAGVTAILPLCDLDEEKPELLLTGSYDEYVRVLTSGTSTDRRKFQCLAEKRLYGGVWRLVLMEKVVEEDKVIFVVLASCMHAGARILEVRRLQGEEWTIEVVARFEEHESMNYASDARLNTHGCTKSFTVVSTSFYDKKLCVWKYKGP